MTSKIKLLLLVVISAVCESNFDSLRKNLALNIIYEHYNTSMVLSPLLVRFPLCKLATVAQGNAKKELLSALGMKSDVSLKNCYKSFKRFTDAFRDIDLTTLNKIILNYTSNVNPRFLNNTVDYGVKVDRATFTYPNLAVVFVNRWADRASLKRIVDVLEPKDIDNQTSIIVVNGAHLKLTWETPFEVEKTKYMKFHHLNANVSVIPMMVKAEAFRHLRDDVTEAQYINMKLASDGLSITIAVPVSVRGLSRLIAKLQSDPDVLNKVYERMRYERVKVMLPRFRVKTTIDWTDYLQKIGLRQIFNKTNSGLIGILNGNQGKPMYVSKVKQTVTIEADEVGIFGQALKDASFYHPFPQESQGAQEFIADHSFFFAVNIHRDRINWDDMHQLFTGVFCGPE